MKLLDDDESLELLSLHAFRSKIPMEGFKELSVHAVQYCEGNALALEVLGSSLSESNTISNWESQLSLLEKDMDSRIQNVLIRSYKSLSYNSEKELFLHIACFFIGADMDYVIKILERDYFAISGIKTLTSRCLLSVSSNKKLMMHRLIQEMGRNIVRQESFKYPVKRSRVWLSSDSYKILSKRKGSETLEGLALDMQMLSKEKFTFKLSNLKTDALQEMDNLKLLQLNFVKLTGSYENFSEDLRWLCWLGFHLRTIPSHLYMGSLVAIDMSYSNLVVFEPPTVLRSLQILNLKDSHNLIEIRQIDLVPNLETLILWNCDSLVRVCETIGSLKRLTLLNMTGCKYLYTREQINTIVINASTSSGGVTIHPTFSFPRSLQRLFLKDCNLECDDSFPLTFIFQPFMQYLNLASSLFEFLPCYTHLKNLRVLDLSFCSRLKYLLYLPNTLAELYVYHCQSLEKITFESHQFTLQEFGYKGCPNLSEIEGFIKLVPITKLDETDLGHMKWLKRYENHEVCLVGDEELTTGRSWKIQMLYEFDIMSTSLLPDIKDPNMMPECKYISESPSLFFDVPLCPKKRRLKGLNVTFKYTISGEEWAWFAKISTTNGVDLMYNPKVFGKPGLDEVATWLSYWPIGYKLDVGDKVHICIAVMSGLEVHECGVSLVYADEEEAKENNMRWLESVGDLSRFQLSTGAYYLCRHDFFELMEVGRLTPDWFRILVGDTIDYTEVRGWTKTGRRKQSNPSFTELKTIRCIIHGPEVEDIYKIATMSKPSFVDRTVEFISRMLGKKKMKSVSKEVPASPLHVQLYHRLSTFPKRVWIGSVYQNMSQVARATQNFSPSLRIGEGRFGTVYKAQLPDGQMVAIKRAKKEHFDALRNEFRSEVELFAGINHLNLVKYLGYVDEGNECLIITEYVPNGTLREHLDGVHGSFLDFSQRLEICIDIAHGLSYLHLYTKMIIIHRNVKSSNILLTQRMRAKLGDFGLTPVEETTGYLDPEYTRTYQLTPKSDVYSFGVLLIEILTGRRPIELRRSLDERVTIRWAFGKYNKGDIMDLVDPHMKEAVDTEIFAKILDLAFQCATPTRVKRPDMKVLAEQLWVIRKDYLKKKYWKMVKEEA